MREISIDGQKFRISFKHINLGHYKTLQNKLDFDHEAHKRLLDIVYKIVTDAMDLGQVDIYRGMGSYYRIKNNVGLLNGITVCELLQKRKIKSVGIAVCGNRDQFNKKTGRKISLDRALHDLKLRDRGDKDLPKLKSWIYAER